MKIASHLESIIKVDAFLAKVKEEFQLTKKHFSYMLISVNEAVTNAIKHGNSNDSAKWVIIEFERSSSGTLIFTIADEGNGFNWRQVEGTIANEKQGDKEGGRGLFIMKKLADKRVFNNKGNKVALHFKA